MMDNLPIVVIKFGALGDVVRTSYFCEALIKRFGSKNLVWVTSKQSADLLRFNPFVSKIICPPQDELPVEAEVVISLDDELESVTLAGRIRSKKLIGAYLDESNSISYSNDSSLWFDMGLISKFGKEKADALKKENLLGHAEIFSKIFDVPMISPSFYGNSFKERVDRERRSGIDFLIGINPFAGKRWVSKQMPADELGRLLSVLDDVCDRSKDVIIKCWLLSDKSNFDEAADFVSKYRNIDLVDTSSSVHDFAAAIKATDYLISADSLGLHLAIAQGIPSLSFFAPTSAPEIDTFGLGVKVSSNSDDYCSYKPNCDNSSITGDRVISSMSQHLLDLSKNNQEFKRCCWAFSGY